MPIRKTQKPGSDALHVGTAQPREVTPSGHACGSFTYALTFMNKLGIQQGL